MPELPKPITYSLPFQSPVKTGATNAIIGCSVCGAFVLNWEHHVEWHADIRVHRHVQNAFEAKVPHAARTSPAVNDEIVPRTGEALLYLRSAAVSRDDTRTLALIEQAEKAIAERHGQ